MTHTQLHTQQTLPNMCSDQRPARQHLLGLGTASCHKLCQTVKLPVTYHSYHLPRYLSSKADGTKATVTKEITGRRNCLFFSLFILQYQQQCGKSKEILSQIISREYLLLPKPNTNKSAFLLLRNLNLNSISA